MVVGFPPRDEAGGAVVVHLAEAEEGAHLVDVAADDLRQPLDPADQRVGVILRQLRFAAQAMEHGVEQREAFGIGRQRGVAHQVDEGARDLQRRADRIGHRLRRRGGGEQVVRGVADLPHDIVRRDVCGGERTGGIAPRVDVVGGGEGYDPHRECCEC